MQFRNLRRIRQFQLMMLLYLWPMPLSVVAWIIVIHFSGVSKFNIHKLQCIQNSSARIVSNTSRYTSITLVLMQLQWLPEHHTVLFISVFTLVFQSIWLRVSSYSSSYSRVRNLKFASNLKFATSKTLVNFMKKMMFLSKNWYFSVQKAIIYYTFNKSHHYSFILLVFSHVANFRYVANFRFLTLPGAVRGLVIFLLYQGFIHLVCQTVWL